MAPTERLLTNEELAARAKEEADRIRQAIKRQGTAKFGNVVKAYIQGRWVGEGDTLELVVGSHRYRLLITQLTSDNIELEPHRITEGTKP